MYRLQYLARFWNDDRGISLIKYAVFLAFLSAGFLIAAELLGDSVRADGQEV